MTNGPQHDAIDWSLTTWEGSRRAQLREWRKLSLRERLEALDAMQQLAEAFAKARKEGRLTTPRRRGAQPGPL